MEVGQIALCIILQSRRIRMNLRLVQGGRSIRGGFRQRNVL